MKPTSVNGLLVWGPVAATELGVWFDDGRVTGNGLVVPHTVAEARAMCGAEVVGPGPMFDIAKGKTYREAKAMRLLYALRDRAWGIDHGGVARTDRDGGTLCVVAGRAVYFDGEHVPDAADVAIQCAPTLVRRGQIAGRFDSPNALRETWRPALGVLPDGRIVLALGRTSLRGLAAALYAYGCPDVGHLDGGGSGTVVDATGGHWGSTEDRRLAAFVTLGGRR